MSKHLATGHQFQRNQATIELSIAYARAGQRVLLVTPHAERDFPRIRAMCPPEVEAKLTTQGIELVPKITP
jgi:hypothetical protein